MRKHFSILLLIVLMMPVLGHSKTAERINEIARKALDKENLVVKDRVIKL